MADYSHKTTIDMLGVKDGDRVLVLRAPAEYTGVLQELDQRFKLMKRLGGRFEGWVGRHQGGRDHG